MSLLAFRRHADFLFCPSDAGRSLRELGLRATRRGRPVGLLSCCAALLTMNFGVLNRLIADQPKGRDCGLAGRPASLRGV